jgi:hypothetical protein
MMASDLDAGQFEIRPLDDPPFHSEFVFIESARKVMSSAAATFAALLTAEAEQTQCVFRDRVAVVRAAPRRGRPVARRPIAK